MRRLHALALAVLLLVPTHPQAQLSLTGVGAGGSFSIPPPDFSTCAPLPSASGPFGNVWHVDPINGTTQALGADGSLAHPWNSLPAVFGAVAGYSHPLLSTVSGSVGPVQPGDEILLASGAATDYGVVTISRAMSNSDWVTIAPEPGAKPVFQQLNIQSASINKLAFRGIYVEKLAAAILVSVQPGTGNVIKDILFDGITVAAAEDSSPWTTQALWTANLSTGIRFLGGVAENSMSCGTLVNSHIYHTTNFAVALIGDQLRAENNELDHFGIDGIDFAGDNIALSHNHIHDFVSLGLGAHTDGMQGGSSLRLTYHDILIDSNRINLQEDPALPFLSTIALNGAIDTTDEDWTRINIVNNEVYFPAPNAVGGSSWHDSIMANNTIFGGLILNPPKGEPGQTPNSNDWVVNNLTSEIGTASNPAYHPYHNLIMQPAGGVSSLWLNGIQHLPAAPGTYDGGNVLDAGGVAAELGTSFDGPTFVYDAHLIAGAPAIGFGTSIGATPLLDLNGNPRGATIDAGALQFGSLP